MTSFEECPSAIVAEVVTYPVKSLPGVIHPEGIAITENGLVDDRLFTLTGALDSEEVVAPRLTLRECPELARIETAYVDCGIELKAANHEPLVLSTDIATGRSVEVKSWGGNVTGIHAGHEASDWLSSVVGQEAHILAVPDSHRRTLNPGEQNPDAPTFTGRGTDGYPLHVVSLASLRRFNEVRAEHGLEPVGIEAFRANIVIDGESLEPFTEDKWDRMRLEGEGLSPVDIIALRACARCKTIEVNPETGNRDGRMLKTLAELRAERNQQELVFGVWAAPSSLSVGGIIKAGQSVRTTVSNR